VIKSLAMDGTDKNFEKKSLMPISKKNRAYKYKPGQCNYQSKNPDAIYK